VNSLVTMPSAPEAIAYFRHRLEQTRQGNFKPPPSLNLVEWADQFRMLSPESSSTPGRWDTSRVEVARGPMLAVTDPTVHTITVKACTQLLKTELINNIVGYFIDQDPSPILQIQPDLKMAESWSKDRLAPMLRDTPVLRGKVKDARIRDSNNTILHKQFPGGHITMAGSNSPADLASRPIKITLADEIDKYNASAGKEGDPISIAEERAATFWNRKHIRVCSPTIKGASRIEESYEQSDKRRYFVPCPHCQHEQHLVWSQVKWQKGSDGEHLPETAAYSCIECGSLWSEAERLAAIQKGRWVATASFKGHAGFHVNKIASPWEHLSVMVEKFLKALKKPEQMKVFVNTQLAEEWEEEHGELIEEKWLMERRENWGNLAPEAVVFVTAGVDVQDNRLEVEIFGWGVGEEKWSLEYRTFYGSPGEPEVWRELDILLQKPIETQAGYALNISCTCIDSGGHHSQSVYDFCKSRLARKVFAIKGASTPGKPIFTKPSTKNKGKVLLYSLGVDTAKERIYSRLKITEPGENYCHFPMNRDEEYFRMLVAEKAVVRIHDGRPCVSWELRESGRRNEVLDLHVYGLAALYISNVNLERWAEELKRIPSPPPKKEEKKQAPHIPVRKDWLRK
jgi:phage terminase large subunit GpA-like protein